MQTYLRLLFELNLSRLSAADRETLAALTSHCQEQEEELKRLRADLEELPSLKEKLAKCVELKERLVSTEEWRERARKQLEGTVANLDTASNMSATLGHEIGHLTDVHAKLVRQNQLLLRQVSDDSDKFQTLLSAARIYKLCLGRKSRMVRDWLSSDEPEASSFLGALTTEMVGAGTMISGERFRLAAAELGVDFDSLLEKANEKGNEALANLAPILDRESAVLVDPHWDAEEAREWSERVDPAAEKEALCLDLDKLSLSLLPLPRTSPRTWRFLSWRVCV